MNIKIQGGGDGRYANKGSCISTVRYMEHEDMERAISGKGVTPFFNDKSDYVSSNEVAFKIDHNKAQLRNSESKFFVITVSPSQEEIKGMGKTLHEKAEALKKYVREDVMQKYSENFNRGLNKENIMYYGKIHFSRGDKPGEQLHAHVIVSRKDIEGKIKLSPKTNHRSTQKGAVKGGFDREKFVLSCEKSFDGRFNYERSAGQSFEYLNAVKNGNINQMKEQVSKKVNQERNRKNSRHRVKTKGLEI